MKYIVEKSAPSVTWYKLINPNAKKETFVIEIVECENPGGKNSLPLLWNKAGYIDRVLDTYLCIHTYCTDSEGMCYSRYNPQTKLSEDGKRNVINFDWMFENTEENRMKLINEAIRLFESATGRSATEIKMEKINNFAKERGLEVLDKIPEGWYIHDAMTYPAGCTRVVNGKAFSIIDGKLTKNENYKEAVLI